MTVTIKANNNFHTATKETVFDKKTDTRFLKYRALWNENPERFIAGEFPLHLDIESSSVCNLRCPFCATTHNRWGRDKRGFMDFDLFRKIIDEGADNDLYAIKLSLRGEPLLHPDLVRMVAYAKRKGIIDVYFNTNAVLLNEELFGKLIDAGLDRISISIEGFRKEVYEKFRVGAKFERLIENVGRLRHMRESRGVAFPQIRIQTVLLEELKGCFKEYVNFWKKYADEVSYLDARQEGAGCGFAGKEAAWACPFLWQRMTILRDGTILPCLMHGIDDFASMIIGNAGECSIKDIWKGAEANFRRKLHEGGKSHEIQACRQCSYREMEVEKLSGGAGE